MVNRSKEFNNVVKNQGINQAYRVFFNTLPVGGGFTIDDIRDSFKNRIEEVKELSESRPQPRKPVYIKAVRKHYNAIYKPVPPPTPNNAVPGLSSSSSSSRSNSSNNNNNNNSEKNNNESKPATQVVNPSPAPVAAPAPSARNNNIQRGKKPLTTTPGNNGTYRIAKLLQEINTLNAKRKKDKEEIMRILESYKQQAITVNRLHMNNMRVGVVPNSRTTINGQRFYRNNNTPVPMKKTLMELTKEGYAMENALRYIGARQVAKNRKERKEVFNATIATETNKLVQARSAIPSYINQQLIKEYINSTNETGLKYKLENRIEQKYKENIEKLYKLIKELANSKSTPQLASMNLG